MDDHKITALFLSRSEQAIGKLAEKYGLVPETRSKYRRALGLARGDSHV